ncbi:hypothetical protein COT62_02610 [Candidatus Roizmanbacteria bacterium CG09_land_8_20_14_0_10_41_9]|uniref:Uncharacterized protein n=1 Tax=Candidatus Roizmanbacteria bacterium CG09_land_8_20_14_0_10_41_9 TaxID=1974850 RepID=A0A2H0WSM3_9BACT|nr:MAG: hypothetical protein COT62_02610 [Candidatus Roizmanbacteria bacterium CG09_land_8_20_14_0_10_41_9]
MDENFFSFSKKTLRSFFEFLANILIFIPYYFSVNTLVKTLFHPWKNLISRKATVGFSLSEWFGRLGFDLISIFIGFSMRLCVLGIYLVFQILFLFLFPFFILMELALLPVFYVFSFFKKTTTDEKNIQLERFLSTHLMVPENRERVVNWFEELYQNTINESRWWTTHNLFSIPPVARDWALGYTPTLDPYVFDLTSTDYQKKLRNVVNREKEINEIERTLSKSEEANVLIVGEEGVGKHTIVDALAKRIYEGKTNQLLMYKRVLKLNMEKILTQYTDQKQREEFFGELLKEAADAKNVILLIDDMEKYIFVGEGRVDLSIPLQTYAKSSFLQILGITDSFSYQKFVFPNEAVNRLFQKIDVYEVPPEEAEHIMLLKTPLFEKRYNVTIPYETVKNTIDKSNYYITYIPFPEKAVDLLDSACVYTKQSSNRTQVLPEAVDKILTEQTHIPTTITAQTKERLLNLQHELQTTIIDQEEAVEKLSSSLKRAFLLIGKRKKPLATFLFLGPTGVGKTETAKSIARIFFGSETYLIRFDMSLYQSKNDIPNLIGSSETNTPGLLTKAIREKPYGVLLLDEIEKANEDLLNIFLTLLDEGYITDGSGKRVDCKNLVIIATSNAGSSLFCSVPENGPSPDYNSITNYLIEQKIFAPEFLNRFDGIIVYKMLSKESIFKIAKQMVGKIQEDIKKLYNVTVVVSDAYVRKLVDAKYDEKFGARDMERVISEGIENTVSQQILENTAKSGDTINLT